MDKHWDVIVIGAGPAGLAAALAAQEAGARVCIIEREERTGGILKQCIHDGFGLIRFKEKLTGPEYAYRYVEMIRAARVPVILNTFVLSLARENEQYSLTLVNSTDTVFVFTAGAVILATGCRERTAYQVFIHGTRPAGVLTAGQAQYYINIQGYMPGKKCVILGSGDIGLIMARRLTLEGARVLGVYEILAEPSGLTRNIAQCLLDYKIPLHLNSTVTRVHGKSRVKGVTVNKVDKNLQPIEGTEEYIECDTLLLSVGLIPENDIAFPLNLELDPRTRGPVVDQNLMTSQPGIFSCGNALHVSDLVDYVSENGASAGKNAAQYALSAGTAAERDLLIRKGKLLYTVPQVINPDFRGKVTVYFRSAESMRKGRLQVRVGDDVILTKKYPVLRPPEMERFILDLPAAREPGEKIIISLDKET